MSIVRVTPKEESRESGERNCAAAQTKRGTMQGRDFSRRRRRRRSVTSHSIEQAASVAVTDESIYHACAKLARHEIGGIANRQVRPQHFGLRGSEFTLFSSHTMEDTTRFMKVKMW